MNDAGGERRFDPTPARRERAKREGNAARSAELASLAAFGGALAGLVAVLPACAAAAAAAVRAAARADPGALVALGAAAAAPALCASVAAASVTLLQSGGVRLTAPRFVLGRLAPASGLRRMFGTEAAVAAVRAAVAFAAVLAAVTPIVARSAGAALHGASPAVAAAVAWDGIVQVACAALAAGGAFAAADYGLARRRWLHGLKMSADEVRRDAKEHEGDPHAKSRRRQLHRSLSRGAVARTREASFVVVNPTHVAIALRYAPPDVPVPEILVRAADERARDVRALAERLGIPIVEEISLARLLWRTGEAGRPIPPETFVAVAIVIAGLMRDRVLMQPS